MRKTDLQERIRRGRENGWARKLLVEVCWKIGRVRCCGDDLMGV
jgi:hypothetical protein